MNSIYKVIWSKAKNCYVVASEIAKSHTKSASGSEKMGGYGKKALLALAAASAIFCGGLVNVGATVHVNEGTGATSEVYTTVETYNKTEVDNALTAKGAATDVATNKADIANLKTAVGDAGSGLTKAVADQKADIATNRANINNLDGKLANLTTTVNGKADQTAVTALDGRVGSLETTVGDASSGLVKDVADLKNQGNDLNTAIGNKADQSGLDAANAKITDLQKKTTNLSADGKTLTGMTAVGGATVSANKVNAGELKVTGNISDGNVTTTLEKIDASMKQTETNKGDIADLKTKTNTQQTWIGRLNDRTTQISYDAAKGTTVNGVEFKDSEVDANGKGLTGVTTLNTTGAATIGGALKADSLIVENASNLKGDVTMDKKLSVTGDTTLKGTKVDGKLAVTDDADLKNTKVDGTLTTTGKATFQEAVEMDKGLTVTSGDTTLKGTKVDGKLAVTDDADLKNTKVDGTLTTTGKATFQEAVEMDKGLTVTNGDTKLKATTVDGKLTAGDAELKNTTVGGTLGVTGETTLDGALTAKGEATFEKNVTAEKDLTVKGTLNTKDVAAETIHISKSEDTTDYKSEGSIIGEGGKLSVSNEKFDKINNITEKSELNVNEKGTVNWATSKDNATGNVTEGRSEVTADKIKNSVKKTEGGTTFGYEENITETGKVGTATDKDGNRNELTQTATGTENTVTSKDGNKSTTKQEAGSISSTVYDKDGNVKASSEMKEDGSISNNATGDMTNTVGGNQTNTIGGNQTTTVTGDISNTAKNITNKATEKLTDEVGDNTRVTTSTSITDSVGATTNRKIENGTITDTAGDFTVTTDKANGTTFAKTGSTAYSAATGAPTDTNIAGNLITTGRVDANELGVSDKDGANTADLSVKAGEGVKASAGNGTTTGSLDVKADEVVSSVKDADGKGSTFKQRVDAIMMESKDVSIKAEETLTNEAKVITNKASEVINNEAININNTAKGIITSKASEIKNQADKLISNKVGENTWENMENGKITTSIKDGAKQNLTQSDAAGTTQSTVDGGKSTVTIQNADGLTDAVTDGRNTSVQNQTASQIAAAVKDGAGNENASVANATTSANTITNGTKANTVISTADGTSFINSEAAAPVTGASGAGTAVNTTIKGNTINTGKVTMDYAEVMKDLGVHGNAKVDQNLEVGGTSTLKGDVTMESNAKVKKDLTVEGTTTTKTLNVTQNATVGGTLEVTGKATFQNDVDITGNVTASSYKVGSNTYIDANGINANNQKITNVADGSISVGSKDAVNGGQLYGVKRDLEHQVDKVGANAAAMANLRPMEFDPSSKWNIAAAIGNYGSETAAAIGAFYRPNDNVMVNLSTAFGTGENMVGGGVSVRLGKGGNKLSREETNALKAQVADLTARMDALLSVLNPNMSKDFPDVPENHWAYEAVSRLAGNDIVQGYPDGEFHGERTMTRYEMAEIIYNALSRGAEAERKLVEEFKPELQAMAASEKSTAEKAEG